MELNLINDLVTNHGFGLRSWNDRYSKGVWVCIAPNSYLLSSIEESSDAGDLDMIPAMEYLLDHSACWLPFVVESSYIESLKVLENRLSKLESECISRDSQWSKSVTQVIDHLLDIESESKEYGGTEGKFKMINSDYLKPLVDRPVGNRSTTTVVVDEFWNNNL